MSTSLQRRRRVRWFVIVPIAVVALLLVIGGGVLAILQSMSGDAGNRVADHTHVTVQTRDVKGIGQVLTTDKGYTLYAFDSDAARKVSCTGTCTLDWPPLKLDSNAGVAAGSGVSADLLGTVANPGGGRIVTYHGWPLYTFASDSGPNMAKGQAKNVYGGHWYAIRPSGDVIGRS